MSPYDDAGKCWNWDTPGENNTENTLHKFCIHSELFRTCRGGKMQRPFYLILSQ